MIRASETFSQKRRNLLFLTGAGASKSLVEVIQGINADKRIPAISLWDGPRKFANRLIQKAEEAMIQHAIQWKVTAYNLKEKWPDRERSRWATRLIIIL